MMSAIAQESGSPTKSAINAEQLKEDHKEAIAYANLPAPVEEAFHQSLYTKEHIQIIYKIYKTNSTKIEFIVKDQNINYAIHYDLEGKLLSKKKIPTISYNRSGL